MLARNYMTAEQLGITDVEQDALRTVLGMLERGELVHGKYPLASIDRKPNEFNMGVTIIEGDCGSIACMCGWGYIVSNKVAFADFIEAKDIATRFAAMGAMPDALRDLFGFDHMACDLQSRAPEQCAIALRSYLTTGDANWAEALHEQT